MSEKVTIRSSVSDSHGDQIPLELLEDGVGFINGEYKMRQLANHRRDLPPVGFWDNAELVLEGDIYHLKAEPLTFKNRENVSWDDTLLLERADTAIQLSTKNKERELMLVTIDKNNFTSYENFLKVAEEIKAESSDQIEVEPDMRKAHLPDPRVIITLANYYFILYPLIKPFIKKMGEKIADDIADDVYKFSKSNAKKLINSIGGIVKKTRKNTIPVNKPLITIFEIPGQPYIELFAKTDDSERIIKSISPAKLLKIHERIAEISVNVDIKEIYFNLTEKNQWKFTYLITEAGEVIGTRTSMKKRDELVNRINLSPTKGYSIGANVKY